MEATKFDDEKVKFNLLPPKALLGVAEVFTFGAEKYEAWNWTKGLDYSRLYSAAQRHLNSWYSGETNDPETGKNHLYHAACCLMMLAETQELNLGKDDRPGHLKVNMARGGIVVDPRLALVGDSAGPEVRVYPKDTVGYWLNMIPDITVREKSLSNAKHRGGLFRIAHSIPSAIDVGFVWAETPEGHKYWLRIKNKFS